MLLSDLRHLKRCVITNNYDYKYRDLWDELQTEVGKDKALHALEALSRRPVFHYCRDCEIPFGGNAKWHHIDGEHLCDVCKKENWYDCYNCGDLVYCDDAYSLHDNMYCESCYADNSFCCDGCGDRFHNDDCHYDEHNDSSYCSECAPGECTSEHIRSAEIDVTEYFSCKWLHMPGEVTDRHGNDRTLKPTLWMGWELEVTARTDNLDFHDCCTAIHKALAKRGIQKEDGSLPSNGIEIVSLPGTLKFHQQGWGEEFFAILAAHARGWTEDKCGMHVHMSRAALTHLQVARMVEFLERKTNDAFVTRVAGRGSGTYCKRMNKTVKSVYRANRRGVIGAGGLGYREDDGDERYKPINLGPGHTIEVRIFRSNVSMLGFLKNIEFCDALANFCAIASNMQLDQPHFLAWVDVNRGVYPNLTAWAVREGMMQKKHEPAKDAKAPALFG